MSTKDLSNWMGSDFRGTKYMSDLLSPGQRLRALLSGLVRKNLSQDSEPIRSLLARLTCGTRRELKPKFGTGDERHLISIVGGKPSDVSFYAHARIWSVRLPNK